MAYIFSALVLVGAGSLGYPGAGAHVGDPYRVPPQPEHVPRLARGAVAARRPLGVGGALPVVPRPPVGAAVAGGSTTTAMTTRVAPMATRDRTCGSTTSGCPAWEAAVDGEHDVEPLAGHVRPGSPRRPSRSENVVTSACSSLCEDRRPAPGLTGGMRAADLQPPTGGPAGPAESGTGGGELVGGEVPGAMPARTGRFCRPGRIADRVRRVVQGWGAGDVQGRCERRVVGAAARAASRGRMHSLSVSAVVLGRGAEGGGGLASGRDG
jgi:hypothetical protein